MTYPTYCGHYIQQLLFLWIQIGPFYVLLFHNQSVGVILLNICSYTSIGSIHDTVPNELLSSKSDEKYKPAYLLLDGRLERAGRVKKGTSKPLSALSNGLKNEDSHLKRTFTASIIAVGDEILYVLLFLIVHCASVN